MKSRARCLLDKSIQAMLSAVEIYNKPAFAYREEAFSVLAINSWEILLKARILQIDKNRMAAILEYEARKNAGGKPSKLLYRKKNRSGNYITIGLFRAHDCLVNDYADDLDPAIRKNLEAIVEIRDNAVHYYNKELPISLAIHEIGAACLKNYIGLVRRWFAVDLTTFGIFLMPLAFLAPPTTVDGFNLNGEERHLLNFLNETKTGFEDDGTKDFSVAMTIELRVKRSKDVDAVPFVMSKAPDAIPITVKEEQIWEAYPWTHEMLTKNLQKRYKDFKANQRYYNTRKKILEENPQLCKERLLDPAKPNGIKKTFYSPNIVQNFDTFYERAIIQAV